MSNANHHNPPQSPVIPGVANADLAATILRVALGILFIAHGWLKLAIFLNSSSGRAINEAGASAASSVVRLQVIFRLLLVCRTRCFVVSSFVSFMRRAWRTHRAARQL